MRLPPVRSVAPLADGIGDLRLEHVELRRAGDGADVGVLGSRVADREALHRRRRRRRRRRRGSSRGRRCARPSSSSGRCCTSRRRPATRPRPADRRRRRRRSGPCRRARAAAGSCADRRPRRCAPPVASEPVKNTPSTFCASSAAPTSPPPTSGDEHVVRHAGAVQQPVDVHAGERWRTPTACRAPRCRSAAPARTRCRRRSRGSSRPRCWRPRRAAAWSMRSRMPASSNTVLVGDRRLDLAEEEVDAGRGGRSARCATGPMRLADFGGQRRRQRLELGDDGGAKALRWTPCARPAAAPPRPAAPPARAPPWRRRWRHRRPAARRSACAGGGVGDAQDGAHGCRAARAAARKSSSRGRSSSVPSPARWNSGCHCTAAMKVGPGFADRLDHAVVRAARLDHEAGRQVLDALVVDAVDRGPRRALEQLGQAGAGDELDRVEVAVVALRVAVPHRAGPEAVDVLVAACRRTPR